MCHSEWRIGGGGRRVGGGDRDLVEHGNAPIYDQTERGWPLTDWSITFS